MTIGLLVRGKNSGQALVSTMCAIESIAQGAIGGFVSLLTWHKEHGTKHFECQNGGISSLLKEPLPEEILGCQRIMMISSGANRPTPLDRFLAWDPLGNMVSGHRFPQSKANGQPLNQKILNILQAQGADQTALEKLLAEFPSLDAGYVAMDASGQVIQANCDRVSQRNDIGQGQFESQNYAYSFTFNSIEPVSVVTELLTQRLHQTLQAINRPKLLLDADTRICESHLLQANVDKNMRVTEVLTPDSHWFDDFSEGALIETGMSIFREGKLLGYALNEPYTLVKKGRIESLTGEKSIFLEFNPPVN